MMLMLMIRAAGRRPNRPLPRRQPPAADAERERDHVVHARRRARLRQPRARELARPAQVEVLGGGDEEVEVQVVVEHGRGAADAAEQPEFHEDEDDRERDPAGRDGGPAALVSEVRPGQRGVRGESLVRFQRDGDLQADEAAGVGRGGGSRWTITSTTRRSASSRGPIAKT